MKSNNFDKKPLPLNKRLVPDTSVIIEGFLSKHIESGDLKNPELTEVIIHEAVLAELESQANKGKETGFLGLEEVKRLRSLSDKGSFKIVFKGKRPTDFEIKHAKAGEIDSVIRQLASDEAAMLVTADKVQSLVAESKGISVMLCEFEEQEASFALEKYFSSDTMSVHIREGCLVMAKQGCPGAWQYVRVSEEPIDRETVKELAKQIIESVATSEDSFIESERRGSTVVQLGNNRVVIARPPFSDGYEITAVRPVKKMSLKEYALPDKILQRVESGAEGMLIAGAPGSGKSTFAQALTERFLEKGKVVKTIESPRDMSISREISQYSISHGSPGELQDLLLLSRPDYTVFDEMRGMDDFRLFADLRLSGVGMVGVIHATRAIDAIQRFIGRIDLGVIPNIIDTVVFIRDGSISDVFSLKMDVRVPSGMTESDLARPVVSISDYASGKLMYEIYTYGEEAVVMPVGNFSGSPARKLAEKQVFSEISTLVPDAQVEIISDYRCRVVVPVGDKGKLLGENGSRISMLEKRLGMSIDIIEEKARQEGQRALRNKPLVFSTRADKKNVVLDVGEEYSNRDLDIYVSGDFLISAKSSKKGLISVSLGNAIGKMLFGSISAGKVVEVKGDD